MQGRFDQLVQIQRLKQGLADPFDRFELRLVVEKFCSIGLAQLREVGAWLVLRIRGGWLRHQRGPWEKAEIKVEAERGSDCPHLSLSLSLDLSLLRLTYSDLSGIAVSPHLRGLRLWGWFKSLGMIRGAAHG